MTKSSTQVSTEYRNSEELMQLMARKCNGTCLLAFSRGKDALSAWVELRKYFHTIQPVYYYNIPGLKFIEDSLNYYEDYFKTRVIRLPNPNLYRKLNAGTFQTPSTWKTIKEFAFPEVTRERLCEYVKEDFGIDKAAYTAIGNRMFDNMQRWRTITKFGAVNHNIMTFNPTYDYKIADVARSIQSAPGLKLPVDYKLWGKTFDGFDYRFIKAVKEHFPSDYQKIKDFFPLVDLEIIRYELI